MMRFSRTRRLARVAVGGIGIFGAVSPVFAQPTAPDFVYYGGPVVSNAQVVTVNWNANVGAVASATLPQFYSDITANATGTNGYWNMLGSFYSTQGAATQDGGAGSGQLIGPGSAANSSVTLSPASCPATANTATCAVTEADVDAELNHQIDIGVLPAPAVDASGNVDTVYLVNFPPHVQLTLSDGEISCSNFCNANSTLVRGAQNIAVGFLPDMGPGLGCDLGCGSGTIVENATANASQALVNAVTDPQLGNAAVLGRPLAWFDGGNGYELTSPCSQLQATVTTPSGRSWTVNTIWNVAAQAAGVPQPCLASYVDANGFGLSASPANVRAKPGDTLGTSISSIALAGSAQNIALSTDQLPAGMTASFAPSTLAAVGTGSSTVQLSLDPTTALGNYTINVLGIAQTGERAVTGFVLNVTDVIFADGFE